VLAERRIVPQLLETFKAVLKEFYPQGALETASYGRIVSEAHFVRLKDLLDRTKGRVVAGGGMRAEEKAIEPTIVADVEAGDSLLEGYVGFSAVLDGS
jgi:aldehyde dehydrogenase (NAD+)